MLKVTLGAIGVIGSFVAAILGCGSIAFGLKTKRPAITATGFRFLPILFLSTTLAVFAMQWALISHDFSVKYVAEHNSLQTPLLYTIAGMWASLEGSILLWGAMLVVYIFALRVRFAKQLSDEIVGWAMVAMLGITAFFFLLMIGPANPFISLANSPLNGKGANPLLANHPLMAIHPPILYGGYVGMTIPFAFAFAALVTRRVGQGWLTNTRRWTLSAWGLLTIGIGLGAWWSYEVLGWGGYWGWDPVENASLLPWLTSTAFLHSVLVQERRAMLRVWNLSLVCATFCLTILGTFLTRSGVIGSVHAFSNSTIGPWLLTFFGAVVLLSLYLIATRGDELSSVGTIDSAVSREGALLANNVVFGAFAFTILLGTVFPLVMEAYNGDQLTIGRPYFDTMTKPLGLCILFLMGVAPVLAWRKADSTVLATRLRWPVVFSAVCVVSCVAFGARGISALATFTLGAFGAGSACRQLYLATRGARSRKESPLRAFVGRANGGMIVHLGVIVIAVAIASSQSYSHSTQLVLKPGESSVFLGHKVTLVRLRTNAVVAKDETVIKTQQLADVRIDSGRIDSPAITRYDQQGSTIATPSVKTGVLENVYISYVQAPRKGESKAIIGVYLQPMISWLWAGLALMGLGTILALVPRSRRNPLAPVSQGA